MSGDVITIILASLLVITYTLYTLQKAKETNEEESKSDKIIKILKEYSKNHPDLANVMSKRGLL